jgi:hypothetical protein
MNVTKQNHNKHNVQKNNESNQKEQNNESNQKEQNNESNKKEQNNEVEITTLVDTTRPSTLPSTIGILNELVRKQLSTTPIDKKLSVVDLKRVLNNIDTSIFTNECCMWKGYILTKTDKNCYISFFFKNKKVALHRLLYINYVDNLNKNEYLKYTCKNKGKCCSLKHLKKVSCEFKSPLTIKNNKSEDKVITNRVIF